MYRRTFLRLKISPVSIQRYPTPPRPKSPEPSGSGVAPPSARLKSVLAPSSRFAKVFDVHDGTVLQPIRILPFKIDVDCGTIPDSLQFVRYSPPLWLKVEGIQTFIDFLVGKGTHGRKWGMKRRDCREALTDRRRWSGWAWDITVLRSTQRYLSFDMDLRYVPFVMSIEHSILELPERYLAERVCAPDLSPPLQEWAMQHRGRRPKPCRRLQIPPS